MKKQSASQCLVFALYAASLPPSHRSSLEFSQRWTTKFNESSCEFEEYIVLYSIVNTLWGFCYPPI